jgi:hypothetical protein
MRSISKPYISIISLILFASIILYFKIVMIKSIGNNSNYIFGDNYIFTGKDMLSILFIMSPSIAKLLVFSKKN